MPSSYLNLPQINVRYQDKVKQLPKIFRKLHPKNKKTRTQYIFLNFLFVNPLTALSFSLLMDSDFWTSRLAAAKRQFTLQQHRHHHSSQLDRLNFDDFEIEDEVRPDFPCPYCYEDFDIASLCSHLEDEHSCESKVAVCPICSVKVARDMLSHITVQHGHLFKLQRRRRLRRVAIPNSQALSVLGRDLREAHLQVLLGGSGYRSSNSNSSNAAATDPFLSSLILNFPTSESEEISKSMLSSAEDSTIESVTSSHIWKASFDPSLSYEEREKRMRQAAGRAVFLQDLLVSTLLGDE